MESQADLTDEAPQYKRISYIGVFSAGRVLGAIYGLMGLFVGALFGLMMGANPEAPWFAGTMLPFLAPVFYGAMGFVGGMVMAGVYNVIGGMGWGLEIQLESSVFE